MTPPDASSPQTSPAQTTESGSQIPTDTSFIIPDPPAINLLNAIVDSGQQLRSIVEKPPEKPKPKPKPKAKAPE